MKVSDKNWNNFQEECNQIFNVLDEIRQKSDPDTAEALKNTMTKVAYLKYTVSGHASPNFKEKGWYQWLMDWLK